MTWSQSRRCYWSPCATFTRGRASFTQALMQVKWVFVQETKNHNGCHFLHPKHYCIPRWFQGGVMCGAVSLCLSVLWEMAMRNWRQREMLSWTLQGCHIRYDTLCLQAEVDINTEYVCGWLIPMSMADQKEGAVVWLSVASSLQMETVNDKRLQELLGVSGG